MTSANDDTDAIDVEEFVRQLARHAVERNITLATERANQRGQHREKTNKPNIRAA